MTTLRMNPNPRLAHSLYETDSARRDPVVLFDVGCSGGVEHHWLHFGKSLTAIGFDPLVSEVNRLNSLNEPGRRYEAAFVGFSKFDKLFPRSLRHDAVASKNNSSFERTSAASYARLTQLNYEKEFFNKGQELEFADRHIDLDIFAAENELKRVDFLKSDTDGHEIEVLLGAEKTLATCLAVCIEANFHGADHPYANTFSNIDRVLRKAGFTIVDIEPVRYTRAALPGRFFYNIPAQTIGGSVQWAEIIYARDLADSNYDKMYSFSCGGEQVLKLAGFFDIFGLQDCAAELIIAKQDMLSALGDVSTFLDALTPDPNVSYAEYIASFKANPRSFLKS